MRRAVISDIHANMDAFARVLDDIDRCAVDEIICLGDNIGYGAEPQNVVAALKQRAVVSVMGNHELGAIDPARRNWFNPVARRALLKTVEMLCDRTLAYLAALPRFWLKDNARFVHGFPPDQILTYLFEVSDHRLRQALGRMSEPLCFIGHTHTLAMVSLEGARLEKQPLPPGLTILEPQRRYLLNIGSVGQPRDGDRRAKYVIWDKGQATVELRCVAYDNRAAAAKIIAAGLPRAFAQRLID